MALTLSNFDAALKEWYEPKLVSTINENRVLMTHLERDSRKTDASGRRAVFPVNIRPSQAMGARADGGALPTAQNQTYVEVRVTYKYNYATIQLTHPTIVSAKNDRGAFIRAVSSEMDGIRRDLKNDINRQLFGYGAGVVGTVNGAVAAAAKTITVDWAGRVKVGMVLDSATGLTTAAVMDSKTVSSISGLNITMSAAVGATIADNSYLFREDAHGATALEMMGLSGIVDAGTYAAILFNVTRSTYPEWNAQILSNSGTARAITEDLLDQAILTGQENAEAETNLGLTDTTMFRKIAHLMTPDRRYTPTMTLAGGFKAIEWAGVPIVWDRDCPKDDTYFNRQIFFLDMGTLKIYQLADWAFDDTDGSILHRVSGYTKYDAALYYYAQLGCTDPAKNIVIRDLS
jgi:hypothetical protein